MNEEVVRGEVIPATHPVVAVHMEALVKQADELREARRIGVEVIGDLEKALNLVRRYKEILATPGISVPDPNHVAARELLSKYKMQTPKPAEGFQIFADGVDITEHPDSIPGTVVEDSVEIPAVTTVELVADEEGNMGFIGQRSEVTPHIEPEPEDAEVVPELPEGSSPENEFSRSWLSTDFDRGTLVASDPGPSWEVPHLASPEEVAAARENEVKQVGAFARRPVAERISPSD